MKRDYFIDAARECHETLCEYYARAAENYIQLEDGRPVCWGDNNGPVIYGSLDDALTDISDNWNHETLNKHVVGVATEQWLIDKIVEGEIW